MSWSEREIESADNRLLIFRVYHPCPAGTRMGLVNDNPKRISYYKHFGRALGVELIPGSGDWFIPTLLNVPEEGQVRFRLQLAIFNPHNGIVLQKDPAGSHGFRVNPRDGALRMHWGIREAYRIPIDSFIPEDREELRRIAATHKIVSQIIHTDYKRLIYNPSYPYPWDYRRSLFKPPHEVYVELPWEDAARKRREAAEAEALAKYKQSAVTAASSGSSLKSFKKFFSAQGLGKRIRRGISALFGRSTTLPRVTSAKF